MKKLLFLAVLVLTGCSRSDLPKPEKKKVDIGPVSEAPKQEEKFTGKKLPDDPNRHVQAKVEAAPELVPDLPKKPSKPAPSSQSPQGTPSNNTGSEKPKPELLWSLVLKDILKLSDEAQVKARTDAVKSMLGEKADEKLAKWKSDGLFQIFLAHNLSIEENQEGKLEVIYSGFTPIPRQSETDRNVVELAYGKVLSAEELESGVSLDFLTKDNETKEIVLKTYGSPKIQKLKNSTSDYLVTLERPDGKAMGLVFHADKTLMGSTAALVTVFGMEDKSEIVLKDFNLINFIDIGQEKLKKTITALIAGIEKLPDMISKNPGLTGERKFLPFGTDLYANAVMKPDGKTPGFLNIILNKMNKKSIDILEARYQELKAAKGYIPMEDSTAIDVFDNTHRLQQLKAIKDGFKIGADYLVSESKEDKTLDAKEILDHLAAMKIDLNDLTLAFYLLWKEEPIIIGGPKNPTTPAPTSAPAPTTPSPATPAKI